MSCLSNAEFLLFSKTFITQLRDNGSLIDSKNTIFRAVLFPFQQDVYKIFAWVIQTLESGKHHKYFMGIENSEYMVFDIAVVLRDAKESLK